MHGLNSTKIKIIQINIWKPVADNMLEEVDHGPGTVDEEGDEILRMHLLLGAELLQHLGVGYPSKLVSIRNNRNWN